MKAEVTFSQVYYNGSLLNFFFRTQATETLRDLLARVDDTDDALDTIEDYATDYEYEIDDIEEMFYGDTVEELADRFGIEIEPDEGDEEEDEPDEDWLAHAHEVLDARFPDEDEGDRDTFACEYWQNGLTDEENCRDFAEYIAEA